MRGSERSIYWTSLLVRCFLGLAAWSLSEYTGLVLVEDAALYERQGARIAQEWIARGSSETLTLVMESGREAWVIYWLLAAFSFLLGGVRALPVLIVLFNLVTAWVPVYTYRIALLLGVSPRGALRAARLVVFSPVFAFWAGALYKEGLVLLALNVIVYHGLALQRQWRLRSMLTLTLALSILLGLRFYLAAILAPPLVVGLLFGKGSTISFTRRSLTIGCLAVGLILVGFVSQVRDLLPQDSWDLLAQIQASRDDLASAPSGYLLDVDVSQPIAAFAFLPIGAVYFLSVPLPWELGSFRQNLVIPEMVFWLSQYPLIFFGMREGWRSNRSGTLLLTALTLSMLVFYALFVGNTGTAYRLRAQIWVFWAIFAGWCQNRSAGTASLRA
jgi:hypothetical protein